MGTRRVVGTWAGLVGVLVACWAGPADGRAQDASDGWTLVDGIEWARVRGNADRVLLHDTRDDTESAHACAPVLSVEVSPDPGLEHVCRCGPEDEAVAYTVVSGGRVVWATLVMQFEGVAVDAMSLVDNGRGLRELLVRHGDEDGERVEVLAWRDGALGRVFTGTLTGGSCWRTAFVLDGSAIERTDCERPRRRERWIWDTRAFAFVRSTRR